MTATLIVSFPFSEDVEPETRTFPAGLTLAEALMQSSPDRWGGQTFEIYFGAITPDGAVAVDDAPNVVLSDGDLYHVCVLPAEPVSAAAVSALVAAGVGATTAAIIVYIAMTAISMAISFGLSMLLAPRRQSNVAPSPADTPSSLNSLTPPRNTMRPLSRIPDIYGSMRHWPDLIMPGIGRWNTINSGYTPFLINNATTSEQFVEAVYCVGRGTYTIDGARFGDSGLFTQNGTIEVYYPGQILPASVKLGVNVTNLSRLELGNPGSSNQWSPWFDIASRRVDEIWAQVSWPSGMICDVSGAKVRPPQTVLSVTATIRIEAERLNDAGVVVETANVEYSINAATRNELRQTVILSGITPGRWRARVADVAPNPTNPPIFNGNAQQQSKKGYLEAITGLVTLDADDRTFEHETVVVVRANNRGGQASQNLETFNVNVTRVLPTQDLAAPPGTLTAPIPTRRWISAAIHTLRDPFLCGYSAREIDWQSLVDVHNSLAAYSPSEEEFNGIFDRQMSADEQLQQIARKARAIAFMSSGIITFARDERRAGVSALFNRRNRILDRGNTGIGLRFPGPDDKDGVEITWFDEADDYRQKTTSYPFGVTLANAQAIDLVGATKADEVCRRARFEYYAQLYRRRTQPLRVTEEGQLLLPYDRVAVVAPWDEGVVDGEVLEVDAGTGDLRLDRPLPTVLPGTARIRLRGPDGRETSLHNIGVSGLGPDWCTITPPPVFTVAVPGPDTQLGTLYNISRDDNIDAATHWIMTGAEIDDNGVTLTLVEDADEVFQNSDDVAVPCEPGGPIVDCVPLVTDMSITDPYWATAQGADGGTGYWVNSASGFYGFTMAQSVPGLSYAVTNPAPGEVHITFTKTGSSDTLVYPQVFLPGVPIEILAGGQPNGRIEMDATVEIVTPGAGGAFTTFCSLYVWTTIGSGPPPSPPADLTDYEFSTSLDLGPADTSFPAPVATLQHVYDGTTLSGEYDFNGSGPTPIVGPTFSYLAEGPWAPRVPSIGETIYVFPFIEFGVSWNPASGPGAVVRLRLTNFRYSLTCDE